MSLFDELNEFIPKRILIGCEFSGIVRDEFAKIGHIAYSCDIIPTEKVGLHIQDDILNIINNDWDMMIAFPPCTHLCSSGAKHFERKSKEQQDALYFIKELMEAPIPQICIENPIGILSTHIRQPDQIIQPWQFGHGEMKTTCLWLKNLPLLQPTNIVYGREQKCWKTPETPDRWKIRSKTYTGIAKAMANQWGNL